MNVGLVGNKIKEFKYYFEEYFSNFDVESSSFFCEKYQDLEGFFDEKTKDRLICIEVSSWKELQEVEELKNKYPDSIRLAFIEKSNLRLEEELLDYVHRIFLLDANKKSVLEVVDSLLELNQMLGSDEIKSIVGSVKSIPTSPAMYFKINKAMRSELTTINNISDLVKTEAGLVIRLLRLANSSFYSSGKNISDINQAITRLGLEELKRLVLTAEVFRNDSLKNSKELKKKALITSKLSEKILRGESSAMAGTASLLCEVGKIISEDEKNYEKAGAWLLGFWGFPLPIIEAVAFHRAPRKTNYRQFWVPECVYLSKAIVEGWDLDRDWLMMVDVDDEDVAGWRDWTQEAMKNSIED